MYKLSTAATHVKNDVLCKDSYESLVILIYLKELFDTYESFWISRVFKLTDYI